MASRLDLTSAVILATATLGSAWSAYEAARWSGKQATAFSLSNARRSESVRASQRAFQLQLVDVSTFVAWAQARAEGQTRLADFLRERFRPEFVPAFERWRGNRGPGVEIPPGTPFAQPDYRLAASDVADRLAREAEAAAAEAGRDNQRSDNFIFSVVLFTTVIFFGGIGANVESARIRKGFFALSGALLLFGAIFMLRLPQDVGF